MSMSNPFWDGIFMYLQPRNHGLCPISYTCVLFINLGREIGATGDAKDIHRRSRLRKQQVSNPITSGSLLQKFSCFGRTPLRFRLKSDPGSHHDHVVWGIFFHVQFHFGPGTSKILDELHVVVIKTSLPQVWTQIGTWMWNGFRNGER